jgi:uncharacterized protein
LAQLLNINLKKNIIMKKSLLIFATLFTLFMNAQEGNKQIPTVNVSGEGKIKTVPDEVNITISQETKGAVASIVKKENDSKIDAIIKTIKKMNVPTTDFSTQQVTLNPVYDYENKKQEYQASQTISICLKDLKKYESLMEGLINSGVNKIDNVVFKTSKIAELQSNARKLAVKDAKMKAEDFVSVLGQKVGKAVAISDNSQNYNPQPLMYASMKSMDAGNGGGQETLAIGEIEVVVNVSISFLLE